MLEGGVHYVDQSVQVLRSLIFPFVSVFASALFTNIKTLGHNTSLDSRHRGAFHLVV